MSEYTIFELITKPLITNNLTFFKAIVEAFTPDLDYDDTVLDYDYFVSHSADKNVSPFIEKYFVISGTEMSPDNVDQFLLNDITTILLNKYYNKWERLYNALVTSNYNPIENYNMVEERTVTGTATTTSTQELNQKTTEKRDETRTTLNDIYGFNTTAASHTSGGTETNSTGVNGNTVELQTVGDGNVTTTTSELEPYKLTRSGNIGVTTNQQMITSELELRKNDFIDILFADVDSFLCSKIYY